VYIINETEEMAEKIENTSYSNINEEKRSSKLVKYRES